MSQDVAEQNIQMWKIKKLIKSLDSARGYILACLFVVPAMLIYPSEQEHP